jgi:hypothetical protein
VIADDPVEIAGPRHLRTVKREVKSVSSCGIHWTWGWRFPIMGVARVLLGGAMEWLRRGRLIVAIAAAMSLNITDVMAEEISIRCNLVKGSDVALLTIDTEKHSAHLGTDDNSGWYFDKRDIGHDKRYGDDKKYDVDCRDRVQFVQVDSKSISFGVDYHYNQCAPDQHREASHYVEWAINRVTGIAVYTARSAEYTYQCEPYKYKAF